MAVNPQKDNYQTLARKSLTVIFEDANGQEIAKQQLRRMMSDPVAAVSPHPAIGSWVKCGFATPQRDNSLAFFNVEEYKRPKFKVELATPTEPAKLGGDVKVEGTAKRLHGCGSRRCAGQLPCRARSAIPGLVVLALLVEPTANRGPGNHTWFDHDRHRWKIHRDLRRRVPRPPCRKRMSRSFASRSTPMSPTPRAKLAAVIVS